MKIIILPGNSSKNKIWAQNLKKELQTKFNDIIIQEYKHWETKEPLIDLNQELEKLKNLIVKIRDSYIIIGKSAGVILALKAIYEIKITPKLCIFLGSAINWAKNNRLIGESLLKAWLKEYKIPTLFIQKSKDPAINVDELKKLLNENQVKNYEIYQISGEDHEYNDFQLLGGAIVKFIEKSQ
ncbi:MAG: hypothetical protein KatS3mg095_0372 [Candidatus Parcubacteria bacterium]|nr:MAG: hypothetical protein KatS3mg095_0372 [Candidatus Parcubacteria bacterium]